MNSTLQWLLGLERIRLTDGGPISLRFATPPAPWIMLAGAVLAASAIYMVYRREHVAARWRWLLSGIRLSAVMIVLFLIGQPMLVLRRTNVDPSRVAILLDKSRSMATHDGLGSQSATPNPDAGRKSRWDAAVDGATRPDHGLLHSLVAHHSLSVWTFADSSDLEMEMKSPQDIVAGRQRLLHLAPEGVQTDLGSALARVLEQMQGSPLAAVIVISDGQQTRTEQLDAALAQARARSIPIHAFATGSPKPQRDLAIDTALCEEDVFVHDRVTVHVTVSAKGFDGPIDAELQLRDKVDNQLLATKAQRLTDASPALLELTYRPTHVGRRTLTVTLVPHEDEENIENNTAELEINAHDEKIRVLYVEGSPRFEYRYLKNMLIRESSIESSCLLLSATPGFVQEGMRPIRRFPQSIEELRPYDVIILGDVDPRADWASPVQIAMLNDHVMIHGAGIAFLAGENHMPAALRQTPLERLLPVKIDPAFLGRYDQALIDTFVPRMTAEGRQSALLQLDSDGGDENDAIANHIGWYWFARVQGPQPAATVLLTHPTAVDNGQPVPLAVLGRSGAGRTFYMGTDDFWRCRQTIGEGPYEAFWLRIIRTLARSRKLGGDCAWRLTTDRRRYELGDMVYVDVTADDAQAAADLKEVSATVSDARLGLVDRVALQSTAPDVKGLHGGFVPRTPGHFAISPVIPNAPGGCTKLGANITVVSTDLERLRPEADHEFLRMIASRTGGRFFTSFDDSADLAPDIPDRSVQVADDLEEPLWDKALIMAGCTFLLVVEWVVRKALGLT